MTQKFHDSAFDDATRLKLAIFRKYIESWLPVFLAHQKHGQQFTNINVFDFFAGPGCDSAGTSGSPLILHEEFIRFNQQPSERMATGLSIAFHFNDKIKDNIAKLEARIQAPIISTSKIEYKFSSEPFKTALPRLLSVMQKPASANLVIMDQFGVSDVPPEIVNLLANCRHTDILFFVPSSYLHRFHNEPEIRKYFAFDAHAHQSDYRSIHREVCNYFRSKLDNPARYYLAPFSVKKGSNIYGVIFGSSSLYGLEKFLSVCWSLDKETGEANYDIDYDPVRIKGEFLFPEYNQIKKQEAFQAELKAEILGNKKGVTNLELYKFVLMRGFLPKHCTPILRSLQKAKSIIVINQDTRLPAPTGAFYLAYKHVGKDGKKVIIKSTDKYGK